MRARNGLAVRRSAEQVYRFIIRYKRLHAGDSPSRDEIAAGVGIVKSHVNDCIVQLEAAGRIKRPAFNRSRAIMIPGSSWHFDETVEQTGGKLPLVGGGDEENDPLLPSFVEKQGE